MPTRLKCKDLGSRINLTDKVHVGIVTADSNNLVSLMIADVGGGVLSTAPCAMVELSLAYSPRERTDRLQTAQMLSDAALRIIVHLREKEPFCAHANLALCLQLPGWRVISTQLTSHHLQSSQYAGRKTHWAGINAGR